MNESSRKEMKILGWMGGLFLLLYYLPIETAHFQGAILEAFKLSKWYAREHVLLCLVPAFFIAGAIGVFIHIALRRSDGLLLVAFFQGPFGMDRTCVAASRGLGYGFAGVPGGRFCGRTGALAAEYVGDQFHSWCQENADFCRTGRGYGDNQWNCFWNNCVMKTGEQQ